MRSQCYILVKLIPLLNFWNSNFNSIESCMILQPIKYVTDSDSEPLSATL